MGCAVPVSQGKGPQHCLTLSRLDVTPSQSMARNTGIRWARVREPPFFGLIRRLGSCTYAACPETDEGLRQSVPFYRSVLLRHDSSNGGHKRFVQPVPVGTQRVPCVTRQPGGCQTT